MCQTVFAAALVLCTALLTGARSACLLPGQHAAHRSCGAACELAGRTRSSRGTATAGTESSTGRQCNKTHVQLNNALQGLVKGVPAFCCSGSQAVKRQMFAAALLLRVCDLLFLLQASTCLLLPVSIGDDVVVAHHLGRFPAEEANKLGDCTEGCGEPDGQEGKNATVQYHCIVYIRRRSRASAKPNRAQNRVASDEAPQGHPRNSTSRTSRWP